MRKTSKLNRKPFDNEYLQRYFQNTSIVKTEKTCKFAPASFAAEVGSRY